MKYLFMITILVLFTILFFTQIPLSPYSSENSNITFRWLTLKKHNVLYLSNNKDFSNPIIRNVFGNKFKLNLEPGEYYWKLDHSFSINFKIPSRVSIKSVNKNITNDGNVKEVLSNKFTTFAILNPSESRELKEVYNVTAEQA